MPDDTFPTVEPVSTVPEIFDPPVLELAAPIDELPVPEYPTIEFDPPVEVSSLVVPAGLTVGCVSLIETSRDYRIVDLPNGWRIGCPVLTSDPAADIRAELTRTR